MHILVPPFILEQHTVGNSHGRFTGAALFADVSGFTQVTEALMRHGQHGAEEMAAVMRAIFRPLIDTVYAHDGFVVGLAGDAFTAVFPAADLAAGAAQALAAGWRMQQRMTRLSRQRTDYGDFSFSIKIGLDVGDVRWGIVEAAERRRAAHYFRGTAIDGCVAAEHQAESGHLVLGQAAADLLAGRIVAEPVENGGFQRVTAVAGPLAPVQPVTPPAADLDLMARFYPRDLLTEAVSGEFRLIFNLFISLQGTPDHEDVADFMRLVFALQDQYGGFLNRLDYTDKGCHLLLFWGAPVGHENDAERVLNFALDLRARSPLPLRGGITLRIAHAGFIGSPLREEFTCYGRGVNLAARFMTGADWDELWVDDRLVALTEHAYDFDYLDDLPFKGFAAPVPVYQLVARLDTEMLPFYRGRLVGREAELAQLVDFVAPLANGRFAGALTVQGEPGTGKSRLIHHFLEQSDALEMAELFLCQTDEILRQAINPFRYWLRDYFNQSPRFSPAQTQRHFEAVYAGLLYDTDDDELYAALVRGRSFLGALVDLFWDDSLYAQAETALRFENTLDALKALIRAECRRQPVILLLEDAHWLDDDSRTFLDRLARNMADYPLALLLTSREPLPPELWPSDTPLATLTLGALPDTAVAQLAADFLRQPAPDPALLAFLKTRTDGNPYFVEQMLLYLRENGLLVDGRLRLPTQATDSLIPRDTRALLVARLDRLARPVKEVVQTAAVLGREFDQTVLQEMLPAPALPTQLAAAVEAAVVMAVAPRRFMFRHSLMREAAYDMQVRARLRRLHAKAATAFETAYRDDLAPYYGEIAYHFDQAARVAQALAYYERAADRARDNYQNGDALAYYGRALALADVSATRYRLLLGQESVLNWVAQREAQAETLQALEDLLAALPDPARRAEVALRRAVQALGVGDYEAALTAVAQSVQHAQAAGDGVAEATARHRWGRILWQQGHFQQARPYLERALALAQQEADGLLAARCLYDLGVVAQYAGDYAAAQDWLAQAQAIFAENNDRHGEFSCVNLDGVILLKEGRYVAALDKFRQSLTMCRDLGWRYSETRLLAQLGNTYFELGDYARAWQHHEQALLLCRETGNREDEAVSLDTLGLVAHYLDELDTAVAYFEQALAIHAQTGNVRDWAYALTHLGYTQVALGQGETAVATLEAALKIRGDLGATALAQDTLGGLALAAWRLGTRERAAALVANIAAYLRQHGADGIEFPVQIYLICAQIAADLLPDLADGLRDEGVALLNGRADLIQDADLRRQFLTQVPFNRELMAGG